MARAGFYAVESGKISFRRDGHWYSDDERIENPRIALLFSRGLKRDPDGGYYLQVAEERAPVTVEDTPYVVVTVEDAPDDGLTVVINDETREPLDPATLAVGADNVLYCAVKDGQFRARFLRSAYYHLADRFVAAADGQSFAIAIGDRRYPLRRAGGADPDGAN